MADAVQPGGLHEPGHGAAGHRMALPLQLGMDLRTPWTPKAVRVHLLDHAVVAASDSEWHRGRAGLGGVVTAHGDLGAGLGEGTTDRLDPELVIEVFSTDSRGRALLNAE